jgi:hypothetical protein
LIGRRALLGAALVALPWSARATEAWATYRNTRFGTAIEYPARFRPGRPPDNNDGQSFTAADGAELRVWGSFNIDGLDRAALQSRMREDPAAGDSYSYSAHGEDWFVLSGRRGDDRLFYQRYLLSHRGEVINAFEISYPERLKAEYDPIVARISKSLRPGRGYQTNGAP